MLSNCLFSCYLALWLVFPVACIALASAIDAVLASGSYATIRAHLATITHAARTEEQVREAMDRASEFFALARMAELRADTVRAHDARACGDRALASALAMRAGVSLSFAQAVIVANAPSAYASQAEATAVNVESARGAFVGDDGVSYVTATSLTPRFAPIGERFEAELFASVSDVTSDDDTIVSTLDLGSDDTSQTEPVDFATVRAMLRDAEATRWLRASQPTAARISDAQFIALCDSFDYASAVTRIAGINPPAVPEATVNNVDVDTVRAVMAGRSAGKEFAYRESRTGEPSYEYLTGILPFFRPCYASMRDVKAARKSIRSQRIGR